MPENKKHNTNKPKTVKSFTLGCKVNQYETQLIREQFKKIGFVETQNPAFYIINGCTVTASADRKCRNLIKSLHRKNPQAKIIVTGCYAQNTSNTAEPLQKISFFIPQKEKKYLLKRVTERFRLKTNQKKSFLGLKGEDSESLQKISDFKNHSRAFVKIQDGCDNFCSYCIVPLMRGEPRSRNAEEILDEIEILTQEGFKEIVLCGINLGTWGADFKPKQRLAQLIRKIEKISNLERLRLSSIEFEHVSSELLDEFSRSKKLCLHLHIPVQSGDDLILAKMNRKYRIKQYIDKLNKIRERFKSMSFTTDIMVGFPGETHQQFEQSLSLIKTAQFSRVHVFPFSLRKGTAAACFKPLVDGKTKRARRILLEKAAEDSSFAFRKKLLTKKLNVLFEKKENGFWCGYSRGYVYVKIPSRKNLKNRTLDVRITKVSATDTFAKG